MRNHFTKLALTFCVFLALSCAKSKFELINNFVDSYNNTMMSKNAMNPMISTTAEKTGENEVSIRVISKSDEQLENSFIDYTMADMLPQAIKEEPIAKDLMESGVQIKIRMYSKTGEMIKEVNVNETKTNNDTKAAFSGSKDEQLKVILEGYNKKLPQVDKSTGVKILKIELGSDQDIIYSAEIPSELNEIFKMEESKTLMKDEMIRQPQVKTVFNSVASYDINKLKYQYKDSKGKLVSEIIITKNDIK